MADAALLVVIRLRETDRSDKLKYMSRFTFAALASVALSSAAAAQQVPGRELFEFPLGLSAEAPTLSALMPAGLWNPATSAVMPGARGAIGFAGLTTPVEQGVNLAMAGAEVLTVHGVTASLSYAQASVRDIFRTTTDPQTSGGDIPYSTSLVSLGAAKTQGPLTFGIAARLRSARFDTETSSIGGFDAGAIADQPWGFPVRIAASTFMFSPQSNRDPVTYAIAADVPFVQRDSTVALRGGYSLSHTEGLGREDYVFASSNYRELAASAGVLQSNVFGHVSQRLRLGVGLRYAGYMVSFGREDGGAGISASYQVLLTRVIR